MLLSSTFFVPTVDAAISGDVWWNWSDVVFGSWRENRPMEKVVFRASLGMKFRVALLLLVPSRCDLRDVVMCSQAFLTRLWELVKSRGAMKLGPEKSPNTPVREWAAMSATACREMRMLRLLRKRGLV